MTITENLSKKYVLFTSPNWYIKIIFKNLFYTSRVNIDQVPGSVLSFEETMVNEIVLSFSLS